MARSAENLWLNAFQGLSVFCGVLLAANVTIAVTRPHYPFWTTGIMISAYVLGTLALICYLGAVRQWPMPLAGDRPSSRQTPLSRSGRSTAHELDGQAEGPRPARPPSAEDLDGLDDEQIRLLRACIIALQELMVCLGDLSQTLRPSVDYADVSARTQSSADRAKTQLRALAPQVSVRVWPHKEWALSFGDAERNVLQHIEIAQQSDSRKLAGSVTNLLRLLADQYPKRLSRSSARNQGEAAG